MTTYSLIIVDNALNGRVSGTWLQDCCRGLPEAVERCKATSESNSGMMLAVVPQFGGPTAFLDGARVDGVVPLFFCGKPDHMAGWSRTLDQRAGDAGRAAFLRGDKRVPHHDATVEPLIAESRKSVNLLGLNAASRNRVVASVLGYWLAGFDAELHAQPVAV